MISGDESFGDGGGDPQPASAHEFVVPMACPERLTAVREGVEWVSNTARHGAPGWFERDLQGAEIRLDTVSTNCYFQCVGESS